MKRFQFPLDRVRRWRAGQTALEELKLEQTRAKAAVLREERQNLMNQRARSEQEVLGQPSIEAIQLQSLDAYRVHAKNKIHEIENQERLMASQVEQQRQKVMQARREAELLERLKQKALEEWRAAGDREQETLATELYLAKRVRRG